MSFDAFDLSGATCRIVPLGGLGEIGKNMLALDCAGKILVIDAGLAFPSEDQPGIDLIIPEITYLLENQERVLGIVLTHGHEDHVGALPYILRVLNVPVYGTPMTLGMVRNKLEEHGLLEQTFLQTIQAGGELTLGPFRLEFIRVAHSIVDGIGLGIETPAGRLVHTGDFKLDPTPVDGQVTDLRKFGEWGQKGVDFLLADSTNVERPGYTLSEREVGVAFDEIIRNAPRRVVIACFSSNVHRFQQVVNTAARYGRSLGVLGLSMAKNMRTAQDLGYLNIPPSMWLKWGDLVRLPPEKTIVMMTGSQGEPRSALARAAVGENQDLQLTAQDTVVVSARTIPGNERRIGNMINHLFRIGCQVHYERVSEIHVSGHAAQEELKVIHNVIRPRHFLPIHGETRHLVQHAALARELGMPAERVFVMENGETLAFGAAGVRKLESVTSGHVLVDGKSVGDIGKVVLRDRQHLSQDGILIAVVSLDSQSGALVTGPDLIARGMADEAQSQRLLEGANVVLKEALSRETLQSLADKPAMQEVIRTTLKRYFKREVERFPMIIPVVIEV